MVPQKRSPETTGQPHPHQASALNPRGSEVTWQESLSPVPRAAGISITGDITPNTPGPCHPASGCK